VPLTGGLGHSGLYGTVVAICLIPTVVAAAALFRASRNRPRAARPGFALLAAGTATTAVSFLGISATLLATRGRAFTDEPTHCITFLVAGLGLGLAVVLLGAGLLRLPGVVAPENRLARALDGALFMVGLLFFAWTGFLTHWHERVASGDVPSRIVFDCFVVALPVLLGGAVAGMALITVAHRPRLHRRTVAVSVGTGLLSVGIVGLLIASTGRTSNWVILGSALAVAAGSLGLTPGARSPGRPVPPARETSTSWLSLAAVMLAMFTTAGRVILSGNFILDPVSVVLAITVGSLLTVQQILGRRAIGRIATRLAESEAHFRAIAHTDALTEIANRRELLRILEEEVRGGPACVLLSIDLDGFKNINDIRGHDVGDAVLVEVARRLRSNVRPGDCPARLGGDEFAVLMWARPSEAGSMASRILSVLNQPYELDSGTVFVTASIGLAGCQTADSIDSLLRNADLALRFAKQSGKNRVEAYDVAYDDLVRRRNELEDELRGAVDRGELMLVYQPVVEVATGAVAGVEALLRWHHPRLGTVPPDEFIPLAEEVGLIHGLGRFVVHEAARQLSRWIADGHDLWMSVNASVRELHTPEYAELIREVLRVHRVPAGKLTIEVTEHAAARDVKQLVGRLAELRAIGVRVALDDFGSEYSSLKLLRTLPVDALKIDRELLENDCVASEASFDDPARGPASPEPAELRGIATGATREGDALEAPGPARAEASALSRAPIVDVVVTIGQRLGLAVVAEGVSTPAQRAMLVEYGCRYAQGTLFGGGMPAERVETLFRHVGEVDSAREIRHG
jgi:diguanylate cyclase